MTKLSSIRWGHLGYTAAFGFFGTFATAFLAVVMIEAHGPSETRPGVVVERIEGEAERCISRLNRVGPDVCTTYPTFTLIGELADGSRWLTVGEGPFDVIAEDGRVDVTISTVTGRVVGLDGSGGEWTLRTSGWYPLAIGLFVLLSVLGLAFEARRRWGGRFVDGGFQRKDFVALVPAAVAGLAVVWLVLFSRAHGL